MTLQQLTGPGLGFSGMVLTTLIMSAPAQAMPFSSLGAPLTVSCQVSVPLLHRDECPIGNEGLPGSDDVRPVSTQTSFGPISISEPNTYPILPNGVLYTIGNDRLGDIPTIIQQQELPGDHDLRNRGMLQF